MYQADCYILVVMYVCLLLSDILYFMQETGLVI